MSLMRKCSYAIVAMSSVIAQKHHAKSFLKCASDGSDFSLSVEIIYNTRTITTSGCPGYDCTGQKSPYEALLKDNIYEVPLNPDICKSPTIYVGVYTDLAKTTPNPNPVMGAIGVAFDGVAIYSNSDLESREAFIYENDSFDKCNGHAAVDGTYHYHTQVPNSCLPVHPNLNAHSNLYGFMADGIPIYGPLGDDGIVPTDLDECSGHTDKTHRFYHYHVIANYQYPYTVNCLMGKVNVKKWDNILKWGSQNPCDVANVQYDYSSLDNTWVDDENLANMTNSESSMPKQISSESSTSDSYSAQFSIIALGCIFVMAFCMFQRWKSSNVELSVTRTYTGAAQKDVITV